jgi:hypothetical protein
LENSLVNNWDFMRNDIAIRNFLAYCDMFGRSSGLFKRYGKDFSSKLNINLVDLAEDYINSLIDMSYIGDSALHRYDSSAFKLFVAKIRSRLGKNNAIKTYYSRISEDLFIIETRRFLDNLFINYLCDDTTIVLDQAISASNIKKTIKYFKSSKVIVIDRDPRDIYIDLAKNNLLIGAELKIHDSADKYIKWHNAMRINVENEIEDAWLSKIVLRLNYEDLVYNYKQSVEKIINFFEGDITHESQYSHFNPDSEATKNNVGLWKKYDNKSVMNEISDKLNQYCVDI